LLNVQQLKGVLTWVACRHCHAHALLVERKDLAAAPAGTAASHVIAPAFRSVTVRQMAPRHSGNQIPRKYAPLTHTSNCSVGDPLVIISWLTNHNRNPNTSLGFVTAPSGFLLKGLILFKPNLDYRLMLLCASDPGAPRGCHVAPFPRLSLRRYSKLRPSSGLWAQWALRRGPFVGPLRVSGEGFPRVL